MGTTPEIRRVGLRKLLASKKITKIIEVHNALTGNIAEFSYCTSKGRVREFDAMWASSLTDSTAKGKPDIEAVDTRYTKQWKEHLPRQLMKSTNEKVITISGGETPQATTPGAFLNFGGTNIYKSKQLEQIGEMFCAGSIKDGDYFLYTDAWNPTVIQLRYMAELLGVDIRVGGLWHAGSYDQHDFLGRLIGNRPWVRHAEQSMFGCYDDNFFATQFHIDMFERVFKNFK